MRSESGNMVVGRGPASSLWLSDDSHRLAVSFLRLALAGGFPFEEFPSCSFRTRAAPHDVPSNILPS